MPFKLPESPSSRPGPHELADFAELLAWTRGSCSAREIQTYLGQMDDNQTNVGIDDDDVVREELSDAMIGEIGNRAEGCGGGYPFELDQTGTVLTCDAERDPSKSLIYLYLLMATRLRMTKDRVMDEVDGTVILEQLSAAVLKNYLGAGRSVSHVFGTAERGAFADKIDHLCGLMGEGGRFDNIDTGRVDANDDGLDVVGWVPFADQLPAKLFVFGQCKTGTSWKDHTSKLNPGAFVKRWMSQTVVVDPIRAFFVAESVDRAQWSGICVYGGILFDRSRIVNFSEDLDVALMGQLQRWTHAAKRRLGEWAWGTVK